MSETIEDIVREMRNHADFALEKFGCDQVGLRRYADRIEAAAHNNPTCINCVAVEKWKAKQAAAKAKKEVAK